MMVAGILMVSPARMHSRSSAITSMLIEGGTVEPVHRKVSDKEGGSKSTCAPVVYQSTLTLNVFHQNLAGPRAGVRLSDVIDSNDPEAVAFKCPQVWHGELSGGMKRFRIIDTDPVGFSLILNLDDIAFNGASPVLLWWLPGQSDTVLGLVSHHRSCRHAWWSWKEKVENRIELQPRCL